jgi:hypothetical protein
MRMQDEAISLNLRMRRFKIGVTAPVIDQIPPAGSVKKLLDDQGLDTAWPYRKYGLCGGRRYQRKCGNGSNHGVCLSSPSPQVKDLHWYVVVYS